MRVIAGDMGGMILKAPKGDKTRPTTDRVKESLFAIIMPYLEDATVLDLFAGTGALSIEALSRGAKNAVLVDHDRNAAACIRENIRHTHLEDRTELMVMPVTRALAVLHKQCRQFSLVFADPPYAKNLLVAVIQQLAEYKLVNAHGIIVTEHGRKEEIPKIVENFACVRQESYGDTTLSFWRNDMS